MMFVLITVCLLNSHQSTFGLPVTPAAFRTRVGLTASISARCFSCSPIERRLRRLRRPRP